MKTLVSILFLIIWIAITIWSFFVFGLFTAIFYSISFAFILSMSGLLLETLYFQSVAGWVIFILWFIFTIGPFFIFEPFTATLISLAVASIIFYYISMGTAKILGQYRDEDE